MTFTRRKVLGAAGAVALASAVPGAGVFAQGNPIKIGMSMPQTGSLGAGGQAALLALRMWVDEVNVRGGLGGRRVEFIVYDDQTNPANTPGIYTKLLDVDKVDLLIAPYGTVPTAPIMPLVKERRKLLMGNFSFQVNAKVQHDMWFNNAPWNDASSWSDGFFKAGQAAGAKTVAVLAADNDFAQNLANGARALAQKANIKSVYDQNYPPATTDFSSLIRGIRAARPEMVFVMSYPNDSVAIIRAVNEIGGGTILSAEPEAHRCPLAKPLPGWLQVRPPGAVVLAANDPRIFALTLDCLQHLKGRGAEVDDASAGLAVRKPQGAAVDVDIFPPQRHDLAQPTACEDQETNGGDRVRVFDAFLLGPRENLTQHSEFGRA